MVFALPECRIHILIQLIARLFENLLGVAVALVHEAISANESAQQCREPPRFFSHDIAARRGNSHCVTLGIDFTEVGKNWVPVCNHSRYVLENNHRRVGLAGIEKRLLKTP